MSMERNDISKIGANISKYRKLKKYTQKQLGDMLDVNSKTISKWENGNVAPDITILKSLASVLGVTVDELLSGVKKPNKKRRFNVFVMTVLTCLLIMFIASTCYLYFNKWEVYDFESNHELFKIDGYVVTNGKENRYVITNAAYFNKSRETIMIDSLIVEMYSNDELIYENLHTFDEVISLEDAMRFIDFHFVDKVKLDVNENISLIVKYENAAAENKTFSIDINLLSIAD